MFHQKIHKEVLGKGRREKRFAFSLLPSKATGQKDVLIV